MLGFKTNQGLASVAILVVVALVVGLGSIFVVKEDDQVIEEVSESVLEKQLGLPEGSIDLTPDSKE